MEEQEDKLPSLSDEGVESDYANNITFVPTIWDLKMIFGELTPNNKGIDWHTSITVPWALAKLIEYYLKVNIAIHESSNGQIHIPVVMIPPEPPPIEEKDKDNPSVKALMKYITESRALLVASQKRIS